MSQTESYRSYSLHLWGVEMLHIFCYYICHVSQTSLIRNLGELFAVGHRMKQKCSFYANTFLKWIKSQTIWKKNSVYFTSNNTLSANGFKFFKYLMACFMPNVYYVILQCLHLVGTERTRALHSVLSPIYTITNFLQNWVINSKMQLVWIQLLFYFEGFFSKSIQLFMRCFANR